MARYGPVSLEGGTEEKEHYMGRDPLWEMSGLSHILGTLALGLGTGKRSTLHWSENQWTNRTTLRYLNFTCEECEYICLLSTQSWGEAD